MASAELGLFKGLSSTAGEKGRISYGVAHTVGKRPYMEDKFTAELVLSKHAEDHCLFGVFDGHGGDKAAQFCADNMPAYVKAHKSLLKDPEHALRSSFEKVDQAFCRLAASQLLDDGCTSVVVLVHNRLLYCANAGDSRCVLSRNAIAVPLSRDHKPDRSDERKRITNAGGFVKMLGVWRVQGVLAVSRAIGDLSLKKFVIPTPELTTTEIGDADEFVVLATDGLWDVMSNQEVVDMLHTRPQLLLKPEAAARALVSESYRRGSMDNITAMVVLLNSQQNPRRQFGRSGTFESIKE